MQPSKTPAVIARAEAVQGSQRAAAWGHQNESIRAGPTFGALLGLN